MVRVACIVLLSFITAFAMQINAVMVECPTGTELPNDNTETEEYLVQDNSPSFFIYWDERVRTTLTEFLDHTRQPLRLSITLLRFLPIPLSKCIIHPTTIGFSYADYPPQVTKNSIVTLRKFRI